MRTLARFFAFAFAVAGLVAAAPADAAGKRKGGGHSAAPSFPMKSDEYKKLIDKRIEKVKAAIDKKLDRAGVSAERKKAIHKIVDEEAKDLRAEVARVSADGTVTEAEAGKVKPLTNGLRARVRERLRAEKNPKARATLNAIREKEAKEKAKKEKAEQDAKQRAEKEKAHKAAAAAKEAAAQKKAEKEKAAKVAPAKAKAHAAKATKPAAAKKKVPKHKKKPAVSPTAAEL